MAIKDRGKATTVIEQLKKTAAKDMKSFGSDSPVGKLTEIELPVRGCEGKHDAVERDRRLTQEGKVEHQDIAWLELEAEAKKWHAPLKEGITKHRNEKQNELIALAYPSLPTGTAERIEAALHRSEIRKAAEGMSQQQIEILYRQGDSAVRRALEEIPRIERKGQAVTCEPYISKELRDEVLMDIARREHPALADEIDDLQRVGEIYDTVLAVIQQQVKANLSPKLREERRKLKVA